MHFYSRAKKYSHAVRLAKKFGMDPNLVVLDVFNLKILNHGTVAGCSGGFKGGADMGAAGEGLHAVAVARAGR